MKSFNTVDAAYPFKLRGTNQQTDIGLLFTGPTYKNTQRGGVAAPASTFLTGGLRLGGFSLHNRSGGAAVVGIGVRIPNYLWKAGQWEAATTTFTDDTTDAQDAGTNDFALETTTNDDGFVVLSRVPFNAISINVSTASVDATDPARALSLSTGTAGHTWTAQTNLFASDGAAAEMATGENVWAWAIPPTHTATTADAGLGTGIPKGYYAARIAATTAPDGTAALAATMEIFRFLHFTEALADNGLYEAFYGDMEARLPPEGDALVAYFGTADAQNRVTALVRSAG